MSVMGMFQQLRAGFPMTSRTVNDKMSSGMNRFESLARAILWLSKRAWGLSFLLALGSFLAIVGLVAQQPEGRLNALFEGPVFQLGVYLGAFIFPDYTTRGTNGFYLVPLFGATADFLVLMTFWFTVVWVVLKLRADAKTNGPQRS
jgi:hypothetical protein